MEYYIGQIFEKIYPTEAADWCNNNNAYIDEIEPQGNTRRFEIKEQEPQPPVDVNNLTMTALDFIKILQSLGLTLLQINSFLDNNLEIKTQLTYCNNVYCGVVKSFVPITVEGVTITAQMVEQAFKAKNGVL
jgi:hypothetical protein